MLFRFLFGVPAFLSCAFRIGAKSVFSLCANAVPGSSAVSRLPVLLQAAPPGFLPPLLRLFFCNSETSAFFCVLTAFYSFRFHLSTKREKNPHAPNLAANRACFCLVCLFAFPHSEFSRFPAFPKLQKRASTKQRKCHRVRCAAEWLRLSFSYVSSFSLISIFLFLYSVYISGCFRLNFGCFSLCIVVFFNGLLHLQTSLILLFFCWIFVGFSKSVFR